MGPGLAGCRAGAAAHGRGTEAQEKGAWRHSGVGPESGRARDAFLFSPVPTRADTTNPPLCVSLWCLYITWSGALTPAVLTRVWIQRSQRQPLVAPAQATQFRTRTCDPIHPHPRPHCAYSMAEDSCPPSLTYLFALRPSLHVLIPWLASFCAPVIVLNMNKEKYIL